MNLRTDINLNITASRFNSGRRLMAWAILFSFIVQGIVAILLVSSAQAATSAGVVPSFSNATMIACGGYHGLALKSDGTVWAWGLSDQGQLGDGTKNDAGPGHGTIGCDGGRGCVGEPLLYGLVERRYCLHVGRQYQR